MASACTTDYTGGVTLYECFSKYLLKPNDLILHGYPLQLPHKPGCAYIDKRSYYRTKIVRPVGGRFRQCVKCSQEYEVDLKTGFPLRKNNCHYHWGNPCSQFGNNYRTGGRAGRGTPRQRFAQENRIYSCCNLPVGSEPCYTGVYHVAETRSEDCLDGFVRLPPYPSEADPNAAGIYSVDCEMCFTTKGMTIIRATLLSVDSKSVIDTLIKPEHPVLNYLTQITGLTEEKLAPVTTTLEDFQNILMQKLNHKTILVGHSLQHDLRALKLIHSNVVDTSVMFPHKNGLPTKSSLKFLCGLHLDKKIQLGDHDSLEDARACLQLVLHQIKKNSFTKPNSRK